MAKSPGYFDLNGHIYRFDSAKCSFSGECLYVEARGSRCALDLVGVPFPGVTEASALRGERFQPYQVRIDCKSFNAEPKVLKLQVEFEGETEESGYTGTIEGWLACEVEEPQ